ncbi:four helix bundle protein [Chthoniobacter flavus]|nr:four helix bundle protein [Chthoniobacter flavus]
MNDLKQRTKQFGLRVIRLTQSLPKNREADVIGRQLLRSATSVGANYRAACRGRSAAEFQAKLGIVEEESDESAYWIEMLIEAGLVKAKRCDALLAEANELTAIVVSSIKTSRRNGPKSPSKSSRAAR